MKVNLLTKAVLGAFMLAALAFIYIPMGLVVLNSFNSSRRFAWPPPSLTLEWWEKAFANEGVRAALLTSAITAVAASAIALVLGTLAAFALSRYDFFGRDALSLLIILPIALPGIVTGIALNNVFNSYFGGLTLFTVIVGHATFCVVVVFNNVSARMRRIGRSLEEASMDLGANRMQTFFRVTLPQMRSAMIAGGLLAFGLSFDEIIVTVFTAGPGVTTLPIWIFTNLFRPQQAPIVNVVAAALVAVSMVPIYLAQRLTLGDSKDQV